MPGTACSAPFPARCPACCSVALNTGLRKAIITIGISTSCANAPMSVSMTRVSLRATARLRLHICVLLAVAAAGDGQVHRLEAGPHDLHRPQPSGGLAQLRQYGGGRGLWVG